MQYLLALSVVWNIALFLGLSAFNQGIGLKDEAYRKLEVACELKHSSIVDRTYNYNSNDGGEYAIHR